MIRVIAATSVLLGLFLSGVLAADVSLNQEGPGQWRGSKLAGVPVYGPDDKSVGKITDILVGKDGRIQFVVVGVGGFLGMGEKDVAIPFDEVVFTDEPVTAPPNTMGGSTRTDTAVATSPATAPADGTMTAGSAAGAPALPSVGLQTSADPALSTTAPVPHSIAYPDHGRINMTVDQLKSAPAFRFAS